MPGDGDDTMNSATFMYPASSSTNFHPLVYPNLLIVMAPPPTSPFAGCFFISSSSGEERVMETAIAEKKTYFVGQLLLAHPPVPTLPARRRRRDLAVGVASHPRIAGGGGGPAPPYPTYDVIAMRQLRRPMLASPPLPLPASPPHGTPVSGAAAAACCNDDAWSASESATIDLHRRSQLSSTSGSLWYRTCSLVWTYMKCLITSSIHFLL
ncbi:hypothetical protein DAI22_09g045301 [Oryza sativa Japonica Group]|nr:hypothetical protein DAI22_09g045301 [Oryza sativa Japonica Group]